MGGGGPAEQSKVHRVPLPPSIDVRTDSIDVIFKHGNHLQRPWAKRFPGQKWPRDWLLRHLVVYRGFYEGFGGCLGGFSGSGGIRGIFNP